MAGQDAVNVAKTFNETVGVDGIILTKTDGDTRGGAALSVLAVTGKPIKFQGTGEKLDDLDVFHPDRMASRILGMGDVLSLIERAQDAADEKAAEETAKRLMENKFDMNDMLEQFAQIRKMGGAGAMLSMLPGASGIDASQIDEKAFDRIEAMIYSMTKEEREKPSIINPKRKRRIAAGSGTRVEDVNKLLKQYEMMQKTPYVSAVADLIMYITIVLILNVLFHVVLCVLAILTFPLRCLCPCKCCKCCKCCKM